MKIDEPPTPYLPPRSWDDDDEHHHQQPNPTGSPDTTPLPPTAMSISGDLTAEDLERNMGFIAAAASEKRSRMPKRTNSHDSDASSNHSGGPISPKSSADFTLRRKLHYDEGFKLKQALAEKAKAVDE
eukprot:c3356_g1_i1.p1 GENE.c3356_g1_i1~~c3356_g1_i1.p1  ORF type:complete len:128 (+),score=43.77 c3356_g1_i1:175-558(+)